MITFTPADDAAPGTWQGPNCGENPRWMHVYCPACGAQSLLFLAPVTASISGAVATLTGGWTCSAEGCDSHDDSAQVTGL